MTRIASTLGPTDHSLSFADFLYSNRRFDINVSPRILDAIQASTTERIAELISESDGRTLSRMLREAGVLVFRCRNEKNAVASLQLLWCVANRIGTPLPELGLNGRYFGNLVTKHPSEKLSAKAELNYHRNPYIEFPLHTDAAYHEPPPDWIALAKAEEVHARGGESTFLRLDDWTDAETFRSNPLSQVNMLWEVPGKLSESDSALLEQHSVLTTVRAPVLSQDNNKLSIRLGLPEYWKVTEQPCLETEAGQFISALMPNTNATWAKAQTTSN